MELKDRLLRNVGRKVFGFLCVMTICGIDVNAHQMGWPTAAVLSFCFATYVLGISGEKILGSLPGGGIKIGADNRRNKQPAKAPNEALQAEESEGD